VRRHPGIVLYDAGQVFALDPDTLKIAKQFEVPPPPGGLFFGTIR
jgi:hypothetical protein